MSKYIGGGGITKSKEVIIINVRIVGREGIHRNFWGLAIFYDLNLGDVIWVFVL